MSLAKRLQHEIKSSPAKAGGLALLLVVAVYFWAPLVANMFGGEEAPAVAPAVVAAAPAAPAPTTPVATDTQTYDWRKHAKRIDEDVLMASADELWNSRDPFVSTQARTAFEQQTAKVEVVAPPLSPDEVGLSLTSTFITSRKQVAEINGKSYRRGDRVRVASHDYDLTYRLVEVLPRRVVLERDGKRYEMRIAHPLLDAKVERDDNED